MSSVASPLIREIAYRNYNRGVLYRSAFPSNFNFNSRRKVDSALRLPLKGSELGSFLDYRSVRGLVI